VPLEGCQNGSEGLMRLVSIRKKRHYLGKNKMFRLDLMIQRKVYKQDFAEDIQTAKALRNNYVKDGYVVAMYNDSLKDNKGNSVLLSVASEQNKSY
jgi:hypothetical protein